MNFGKVPKAQPQYQPQWRAEFVYTGGWGAKRWAVRFIDAAGRIIERLMRNGKERTFLRESGAEDEAARRNASIRPNVDVSISIQ